MTRFDIPETVKNFIEVAIETDTVDALDVYGLAITYGDNWKALIDEIILYAYNNRHANKGAHKDVVQAAEAYWMTQPIN